MERNDARCFSNAVIHSGLGILKRHDSLDHYNSLVQQIREQHPQLLKRGNWHSDLDNIDFFRLVEQEYAHWENPFQRISELLFREKQQNLFTSTLGLCLSPKIFFSQLPTLSKRMNLFNSYKVEFPPSRKIGIGKVRITQLYRHTQSEFLNEVLNKSARGSILGALRFLGCEPLQFDEVDSVIRGGSCDIFEITWIEREGLKSILSGLLLSSCSAAILYFLPESTGVQFLTTVALGFLAGWALHRNYHLKRSTQLAWEYQEDLIRDYHSANSSLFDTQKQILMAQSKLNDLQSLSNLGALSYGLVHDMASPLMLLSSYTQALENKIHAGASPEVISEVTKRIQSAVSQLIRLQDMMRKVARNNRSVAHSTTLKPIDVDNFTKQLVSLYEFFFHQNGIKHDVSTLGEPEAILLPEGVAESTLINLIQNSINILVHRSGPRKIAICIDFQDNDFLKIDFVDNAGGIPDQVLESLGSSFGNSQTKGGTGFGLGQIKRNIESSGGVLEITPTEDGTRFTFSFPKNTEPQKLEEEPA